MGIPFSSRFLFSPLRMQGWMRHRVCAPRPPLPTPSTDVRGRRFPGSAGGAWANPPQGRVRGARPAPGGSPQAVRGSPHCQLFPSNPAGGAGGLPTLPPLPHGRLPGPRFFAFCITTNSLSFLTKQMEWTEFLSWFQKGGQSQSCSWCLPLVPKSAI